MAAPHALLCPCCLAATHTGLINLVSEKLTCLNKYQGM